MRGAWCVTKNSLGTLELPWRATAVQPADTRNCNDVAADRCSLACPPDSSFGARTSAATTILGTTRRSCPRPGARRATVRAHRAPEGLGGTTGVLGRPRSRRAGRDHLGAGSGRARLAVGRQTLWLSVRIADTTSTRRDQSCTIDAGGAPVPQLMAPSGGAVCREARPCERGPRKGAP